MTRRDLLRLLAAAPLLRCATGSDMTARLSARPRTTGATKIVLMLHGASGRGTNVVRHYAEYAKRFDFVLLAPDSAGTTWDVIHSTWGADVVTIDRVLARAFDDNAVDPRHIAIGGFSDGASYALSLGLTNGDLFSHIIAFSPGFAVPPSRHGFPRIFISHGIEDDILPYENTRRMVARLRDAHCDVRFDEFHGKHRTPESVIDAAFAWFV